MEEFLRNLGVEVEDESLAQRKILKNKISQSLLFNENPYDLPQIRDYPYLTEASFNVIKDEILIELLGVERGTPAESKILLKLQYLEFLRLRGQLLREDTEESFPKEITAENLSHSESEEILTTILDNECKSIGNESMKANYNKTLFEPQKKGHEFILNATAEELVEAVTQINENATSTSKKSLEKEIKISQSTDNIRVLRSRSINLIKEEVNNGVPFIRDKRCRNDIDNSMQSNKQHAKGRKTISINKPEDVELEGTESDYVASDDDTDSEQFQYPAAAVKTESNDDEEDDEVLEEKLVLVTDDWDDVNYFDRIRSYKDSNRLETIPTEYGSIVNKISWMKLHDYQQKGLQWMWTLYGDGTGGILGDEMGLGKTAQLCVHYESLGRAVRVVAKRSVDRVLARFLVVCPATVLHHWMKEFRMWSPALRVVIVHRLSAAFRDIESIEGGGLSDALEHVLYRGGAPAACTGVVVLVSYEGLRIHRSALLPVDWTSVCLDEGQKIRNPSSDITLVTKIISAKHRLLLSGTPIQNSLTELWSLFDFTCPGRLGTLQAFQTEMELPIRAGGYRTASRLQAEIAVRTAATLQRIIKPYLLRRRKTGDVATSSLVLPKKTEQVLFCRLTPAQREAYLKVLRSNEVSSVLSGRLAAFSALISLRAICNHPSITINSTTTNNNSNRNDLTRVRRSTRAAYGRKHQEGRGSGLLSSNSNSNRRSTFNDSYSDEEEDDEEDVFLHTDSSLELSGKLVILEKILPIWKSEGHKVLLFSQSKAMLSFLERLLHKLQLTYLRLDGTTPVASREKLIFNYNSRDDIFAMVLTTRTGGLGISLTAADRVVLVDPDWNPQTDVQARERAWRIGQKREVTIFRLITKGTIEEKMYQRQIYKLLLSSRILDNPKQKQMFSRSDLRELFTLTDDADADGVGDDLPSEGAVDVSAGSHKKARRHDKETFWKTDSDRRRDSSSTTPTSSSNNIIDQSHSCTNNGMDLLYDTKNIPVETVGEGHPSWEPNHDSEAVNGAETEEQRRERKLLRSLWEGDAISGVYDHNSLEPTQPLSSNSSNSNNNRLNIPECAEQMVRGAMRNLQSSVISISTDTMNGTTSFPSSSSSLSDNHNGFSTATTNRKSYYSSSRNGLFGPSSSSLLSGLRASLPGLQNHPMALQTNEMNSSTASSTPVLQVTTPEASMIPRLQSILRSADSFSSDEILTRFGHLDDRFAILFRETLRRLAKYENGRWSRR